MVAVNSEYYKYFCMKNMQMQKTNHLADKNNYGFTGHEVSVFEVNH